MRRIPLLLLCAALLGGAGPVPAGPASTPPEKWCAPGLKVTAGLELWLDAGRQNAARQSAGRPALSPGQKLDTWYDASGQGRHLVQKDPQAQPVLVLQEGHAAVRFDGRQQHFSLAGLGRSSREITVFVVAAPFANRGNFRGLVAVNRAGVNDYVSGLNVDLGP